MFSNKFDSIISRHPDSAPALSRVAAYFSTAEEAHRKIERIKLDPQRLQEISEAQTPAELIQVIALLVSEEVLRRVVVVESPLGGGIGEFASVYELPDRIRDSRQDVEIDVTPDIVRTFYVPNV